MHATLSTFSTFPNLRVPTSTEDKVIVNDFVNKIGYDSAKITYVLSLPGPKGKFGSCNKHCEEKVKKFGGEIVFGLNIDMNNSMVFGSYHVVWKYNGKLYDVTESEIGQDHQKQGILFVPTNTPNIYTFRSETSKQFPFNFIHIYDKNKTDSNSLKMIRIMQMKMI